MLTVSRDAIKYPETGLNPCLTHGALKVETAFRACSGARFVALARMPPVARPAADMKPSVTAIR